MLRNRQSPRRSGTTYEDFNDDFKHSGTPLLVSVHTTHAYGPCLHAPVHWRFVFDFAFSRIKIVLPNKSQKKTYKVREPLYTLD